ncbi:aldo/keto reductase [Lacticaseibacillus pabuli]|uniref:Aldo/keto reductase n=1 Tax=Lacticaseibacillus pabuli TaxID=3025672 RepID=A0ABY7WQS1_9LACO|nr:aldo/keto reductase [Lacticaseibacillus sp. KACC 23028]WDF82129.1 aldo/keto reductase [Lacticaseibacillus sp. KACC 23028]
MKTIKIGNTNFEASAIALGIMRMDQLSDQDAAKVLTTAKDAGITYIDSADIYGSGASEKKFAAAMKVAGLNREDFYIQSKGGIVLDPARSHDGLVFGKRYDFSKEHILSAVDGILERLHVDYLDSFLLHRPDPLMDLDEVAEAFDELQTAGKVRHFGVSNFNPQQVEMLQSAVNQRLMINQLQFGLMHTGAIDAGMHVNMQDDDSINHDGGMLEYSRRKNMTVQAWSPFQYGMFAGVFVDNPKFPELNKAMQTVADKHGVTKNAIATAWILRHPANIQVILGTMNPQHLVESAAGADVELSKQEWYDLYLAAGHILP